MPRETKVWWNAQKGTWCTDFGGKRRTLAKGRGNKQAAKDTLKKLLEEQALLARVNGTITVACLAEQFLEAAHCDLAVRTYESYTYACQKFVDLYGSRLAHTIKVLDLDHFSAVLKESYSDTTRGIMLRSVVRCFNWGVERDLIPPHGWRRIRFPQSHRRERYLTDDEFRKLLRATNGANHLRTGAAYRRLLLAMDWTCCRPGELCQLQWKHICWERNLAILPEHKTKRTGKPKIIPLIPKMKRLLTWMKKHSTSDFCLVNCWGLPWTVRTVNQRMVRLRKRAGVEDVVPYTLRHRAATNAVLKTGDLKMTSLLLGHTSTAMTERYVHFAQQHLVDFATKAVG